MAQRPGDVQAMPSVWRGGPALLLTALVIAAAMYSFSIRPPEPAPTTQVDAAHLRAADLAHHGQDWVLVGELGRIFHARAAEGPWAPAAIDVQRDTLLTRVHFIGDGVAVAVGHNGWVLRSTDGGRHWQEVAYDAEQAEPLLGVSGPFDGRLYAFGAFGVMQVSDDEGLSWQRLLLESEDGDAGTAEVAVDPSDDAYDPFASFVQDEGLSDRHLNDLIQTADGALLLIGERGLLARSENRGETWREQDEIYAGSFFGAVRTATGALVVYGMRGNTFRSEDHGRSWTRVRLPGAQVSLFGGGVAPDGAVALVGAGNALYVSADDGRSFKLHPGSSRVSLASVVPLAADRWVVAGDNGVRYLDLSAGDRP